MATTAATVDPDRPPPLRLNSIPTIDLQLLSQSELYSLSKCSNSSSDLNRCDDVVIPKIDRSVFNESAGSRKQTYSRLRLAPAGSSKTTIHRRTSRLRSPHVSLSNNDPEQAENSQIIGVLKELFKSDSNFEELVQTAVENDSKVTTKTSDSDIDQVTIAVENDSNVSTKTSDSNIEQVTIAVGNDINVSTKTSDSNIEQVPVAVENDYVYTKTSDSNIEQVSIAVENDINVSMKTSDSKFEQVPIAVENGSNMSMKTLDTNFEELVPIADETNSNMCKKTSDSSLEQLVPVAVENDSNMSMIPADSSFEHLVPIAVENDINVSNVVVPETKRKRGRPRKHETAVSIRPPAAKRMRNNTVKKVVVYDSEKDRETLNSRGVKINMGDLGRLEDPYGPEIRRRTEGLTTQDELLGFLRGINGQWGTTRKKRRVVDAGDFGDVLPKGWRLSLCIKKKEGRVWLFCRRYISPSGRQFESCKDVSIYLLSIVGEESLDKPSHTRSNDSDDSALKGAIENAADVYVPEGLERSTVVSNPPISLPTNCEKQVTPGIMDPIYVRAEEHFKCLKCFLVFDGKIDLLDHQALAHKDAGISDWSIVIGEIFDCRICQKTFYEKNKYNAHVGTHVTSENKTCEASEALTAGKTIVVRETETHDADVGDKLISGPAESDYKISCCTEYKTDNLVHDLNMNGDVLVEESVDRFGNNSNVDDNEIFETQKASVSNSDFGLGHEASVCTINESNRKFASPGGTVDCVGSKSGCVFDQSSGNIQLSPSANEPDTVGIGKTLIGDSVSVEVLSHTDPETRVQTSSFCEKKDFGGNINDTQICSSFDDLTFEKEKVVNSESSAAAAAGVFHGRLAEANKLSEPESLSLFSPIRTNATKAIKNTSFMMSSQNQDSSQKGGFPSVNENRFSYSPAGSKLDARYEVRSSTFDNYNMSSMDGDGVTRVDKEVNFKSHSPMNKESFHIQNNVNNAFLDKSGEVSLDDLQIFRNNESINSEVATLGTSQNGLNSAGVMAFNTRKNIEFSSLVPPGSGNDQSFSFQDDDDVTGMYDSTRGGSSSERGLLDHFCVDETSDDIFGNKMMYSTPLDGLKFDEDRGLGIHDLNLAFGNPHALYEDTIQKKDGVNCSVVSSSKINDTFDVQTDLSMVNKRMAEDLKRVNETRVLQHDGNNTVYSGRTWNNLRSDEFSSSENKFMIASGSNEQHRNEVVPRGMWKPAQGNQLQSGLVNPHSQIQAPSFHSFDIMSDKAEDGVYRVDERYNNNVGSTVSGVRSGRSEPVEFRFLTSRSEPNPPQALQGGSSSRGFPYNTAYEPPFWMGKNALIPPNINMGGRNMVTSVCAFCRNVFYLPAMAINPRTQAGVGSLCPNCTAGISGQVNML